MTVDQRIEALTGRLESLADRHEALTARHEALAQTVELNGHQITDLIIAISKDAENIRSLARIAEAHERRIEHLEEGQI